METYISDDILYSMMLNSDITTIKKICLTNKSAVRICNNIYFWKDKFNHDNLPLLFNDVIPQTVDEWRNEYEAIDSAVKSVKRIFNLIPNEEIVSRDKIKISMIFSDEDELKMLLPRKLTKGIQVMGDQKIVIYYNVYHNTTHIYYETPPDNMIYSRSLDININDSIDLLIMLMYYYPNYTIDIQLDI